MENGNVRGFLTIKVPAFGPC